MSVDLSACRSAGCCWMNVDEPSGIAPTDLISTIQEILDEKEKKSEDELQNWETRSIAMRINSVSKGKEFLIDKLEEQQPAAVATALHELRCSVPSIRTNGFSRCPNHFINATTSLDHCCSRSPFPFSFAVYKFKCSIHYKYLAQWIPSQYFNCLFSLSSFVHTHTFTLSPICYWIQVSAPMFFCTHTHFYVTIHKFSHGHLHKLVIETNRTERPRKR